MAVPQTITNTWITHKTFHRSRVLPSFNSCSDNLENMVSF